MVRGGQDVHHPNRFITRPRFTTSPAFAPLRESRGCAARALRLARVRCRPCTPTLINVIKLTFRLQRQPDS
eukprot:2107039-Prymnesium_polylepis.1